MGPPQRKSAVFIWPDRALFIGDRSVTDLHAHHAVELSVALDGAGIDMAAGTAAHRGIPGAVVRSDAEHQLAIHGPKIAILYIEPRSAVGTALARWLGERDLAPLPADVAAAHGPALRRLFEADADLVAAQAACGALTEAFAGVPAPVYRDVRIDRALAFLNAQVEAAPTQAEVAREVGLSASRFGHLFSEQVGLPMRRYLLWMRLRHALTAALGGASMVEAAHAAGFADAAHFTRTCKRMFGLPPTAFAPVDAVHVASDQFIQAPSGSTA